MKLLFRKKPRNLVPFVLLAAVLLFAAVISAQAGLDEGSEEKPTNTPTPLSFAINSGNAAAAIFLPAVSSGMRPANTPVPDPSVPTNTPVPFTSTPAAGNGELTVYVSAHTNGGNVGGLDFEDEDILRHDPATNTWSMFFDGSDVGLDNSTHQDISAFHILDDGSILFSTMADTTVPGVGAVDNSDIIRFTPTSLGSNTAGSFDFYFDGSDVGLTLASERIIALTMLAGGDLLISIEGSGDADGVAFRDEDLMRFSATSLGTNTAGNWSLYFDGSDVGLRASVKQDIWGASIDGDNSAIYLNLLEAFSVPGAAGDGDEILECDPVSVGERTRCTFQILWDGSAYGISGGIVDGITVRTSEIDMPVPVETPVPPTSAAPTNTPAAPANTPVPGSNREFFLSPTGNDSRTGLSEGEAWATFEHAQTVLEAGDTLILLDGVYYQSFLIRKTGQPGKPITYRAKNDGKVTIDGQGKQHPVITHAGQGVDYHVVIEGIIARNGLQHVYRIGGNHVTLRRVSGYDANTDENAHIFRIGGNYNLIEDCVAAGAGRKMVMVHLAHHNTIRRCHVDWREWDGRNWGSCWPWGDGLEFYSASYNIIENSISYGQLARTGVSLLSQGATEKVWSNGNKILGTMSIQAGMNHDGTPIVWADSRPQPTKHTCVRSWERENEPILSGFWAGGSGTVRDNLFQDILAWGSARHGISFHWTGPEGNHSNNRVNRATIFNNGLDNVEMFGGIGVDAKREDINEFTSFTNSYVGKIWEGGSNYSTMEGEGARLTHRYVDGVLTNEPLWPWPMEDRIQAELGYSITEIMTDVISQIP